MPWLQQTARLSSRVNLDHIAVVKTRHPPLPSLLCPDMVLAAHTELEFYYDSEAWNNGKEVPRWGVAEIQKMSLSTTGRCK